jgi:type VI secretion system protein ImpC
VDTGGSIDKREIPFVVGVLADLSPSGAFRRCLKERTFIEVDAGSFDSLMAKISPELRLDVPNRLADDGTTFSVRLRLTRMASFEPWDVVSQIEPLSRLLLFRRSLTALTNQISADWTIGEEIEGGFRAARPATAEATVAYLARDIPQFASDVLLGKALSDQLSTHYSAEWDLSKTVDGCVSAIDVLLSRQLVEVMHAPEFQRLEAAWRGLNYLVSQTETSSKLKIRVLDATKHDLLRDLERVDDIEQTVIFQKVFTEEYGTVGGQPFGLLVGDYEFGPDDTDLNILEDIAHIAAIIHAPFISSASPAMFGFTSFDELSGPRDLAQGFENDRFLRWKIFRQSDDSRYVGLCVPHILLRLPYTYDVPLGQFHFDEMMGGPKGGNYLWGNTAYALAGRITDAFARYGWCAAVRGVEGGGRVEGLPMHAFRTDDGGIALRSPTDLAITDRREAELSQLGFIPLCYYKGTDMAVFFGVPSVHLPKRYPDDSANASARLSGQIQYVLAVSRFAHFMTSMMREKIGSLVSREDSETLLNLWIRTYVLLDDSANEETKAQFPLREARVEVSEIPGKPGMYVASAYLRPHFQLDELKISIRVGVRLS